MTTTAAKKLVVLGAGRIGQVHAKNIVETPRARLHAVVDVHEGAARGLAERFGATAHTDPEAALRDPDVAGVLVCTSTDTHVDMIRLAAGRGLPIFCEKPIDLSLQRADAALAEVEKAGVPLLMGFNRRFDPSFKALRDAVRRGDVGAVEVVKITSRDPAPPPLSYVKVSGGLFRDMMIHDLDMARYVLGEEPVEVFATGSVLVDPGIGEAGDVDTAVVVLKTARGALCVVENSRRAAYGYDQRLEVLGEKGMLRAENPTPTTLERSTAEGVWSDKPHHFFLTRYADAYRAELDHFLDVIDGSAKPLVDGKDGRRALVLAEACAESLASSRPVALPR